MNLIFLGPPGSGKGTLAQGIKEEMGLAHISTGAMLRQHIRRNTPLGVEAQKYIDRGNLVPDSLVVSMVKERLEDSDCQHGYMLDGFPRTVQQAEELKAFADLDAVILLDLSDEDIIKRLTGRRVCHACGGTFHISRLSDSKVCPTCGGALVQRPDDTEETIRTRLNVYHTQTQPLIAYYEALGMVYSVDVHGSVEDNVRAFKQVLNTIKDKES